jgi:hypothetical protein
VIPHLAVGDITEAAGRLASVDEVRATSGDELSARGLHERRRPWRPQLSAVESGSDLLDPIGLKRNGGLGECSTVQNCACL